MCLLRDNKFGKRTAKSQRMMKIPNKILHFVEVLTKYNVHKIRRYAFAEQGGVVDGDWCKTLTTWQAISRELYY